MKATKQIQLDFVVDKLTNSIVNTISGDSFQTEIIQLNTNDLKQIIRKKGWSFDWEKEFNDIRKEVYKLAIVNNSDIIQGLISISVERDHVFMNLLESAPFNIGVKKLYEGVAGNLVAFACKLSFQKGFEGYVAFTAKSKLVEHYVKTLGAFPLSKQRMIIATDAARFLVEKYFKM